MEREIDLKQISDGKLYSANDMVKAGCNDCAGCSLCCQGMGSSITLDPYDINSMEKGTGASFEELMQDKIELNVVDGIIQPNIKMQDKTAGNSAMNSRDDRENTRCAFLSKEGRCSIHSFRPGFCRMFPLGRIYEEGNFHYFLQVHECPYPGKTKVKVKKWLGVPELSKYENYVRQWHYFLKDMQKIVKETQSDAVIKNINMHLLQQFYIKPYGDDFFLEFEQRMKEERSVFMHGTGS
jgi:hypothetical protein